MAGMAPTVFWFDRFDERIGILPVVGELVHTEELNGEDTLEFDVAALDGGKGQFDELADLDF